MSGYKFYRKLKILFLTITYYTYSLVRGACSVRSFGKPPISYYNIFRRWSFGA